MTLAEKRGAIRHLLGDSPADAAAVYYAYYHPNQKTRLVTYPSGAARATGYICLARTGMDLFRPVITLRLPESAGRNGLDLDASTNLIYDALPGGSYIISAPISYRSLLGAHFDVEKEEPVKVFMLDRGRFQPIINVLVTRSETYSGLPRFIVRQTSYGRSGERGDIVASAGLNWQSARYAEIYVHTKATHRRQGLGRSVVAALVQHVLDSGRSPLYVVSAGNDASIQLAESVGFLDIGIDEVLIEGTFRPQS